MTACDCIAVPCGCAERLAEAVTLVEVSAFVILPREVSYDILSAEDGPTKNNVAAFTNTSSVQLMRHTHESSRPWKDDVTTRFVTELAMLTPAPTNDLIAMRRIAWLVNAPRHRGTAKRIEKYRLSKISSPAAANLRSLEFSERLVDLWGRADSVFGDSVKTHWLSGRIVVRWMHYGCATISICTT